MGGGEANWVSPGKAAPAVGRELGDLPSADQSAKPRRGGPGSADALFHFQPGAAALEHGADRPQPSGLNPITGGTTMSADDPGSPVAVLLVCVTCKSGERPVGAALYEALKPRLVSGEVALRPVECLSVCKRPCTVALAAPGKWTYVVGDLDQCEHLEDVVRAARRYAAASDGLVPWRERPPPFRRGVVSRTPPLPVLVR